MHGSHGGHGKHDDNQNQNNEKEDQIKHVSVKRGNTKMFMFQHLFQKLHHTQPLKKEKTMTHDDKQGGCCGGDKNHEHNKPKKEKDSCCDGDKKKSEADKADKQEGCCGGKK